MIRHRPKIDRMGERMAERMADRMAGVAGLAVLLVVSCGDAPTDQAKPVDSERATVPPGSSPPPSAARPPVEAPPGSPVVRLETVGSGACAGRSLAAVIEEIHQRWPQLADIRRLRGADPDIVGDGSVVYAFGQAPGFALVFKRGGGDCPAGCLENEYWYFATDDRCRVAEVGHFRAGWATGNCLQTAGAPMWSVPQAPDPAIVCGADRAR